MQRSRARRYGALLVGLTLVAAACGDDDEAATDATEAVSEGTEAATEATDAAVATTEAAAATTEAAAETTEAAAETTEAAAETTEAAAETTEAAAETTEAAAETTEAAAETTEAAAETTEAAAETTEAAAETTEAAAETTEAAAETTEAAAETTEASAETTEASEGTTGGTDATEGTEASGEGGTVESAPTCTGESDGVLNIATVLPETGSLAFLGPPEFAGAELAVNEINEAGGVLGADVTLDQGDSGDTSTDIANQTVDRQLAAGADAFIGAASSGVSFTFIDKLVENCKIHFSPANTAPDFTTYADDGLYFRTAPSDVLQGRVLADLMIADGITNATFMALQDPYGEGLLEFSSGPFEEQGGTVVDSFTYDPNADNFGAEADRVISNDPEALVLIGFEESAQILTALFEGGFTADSHAIYLVDGNVGNALGEQLPAGSLVGVKGTLPAAEITEDFRDRMLEVDPDLIDYSYGPETYDAIVITALAAELAGTDDPAEVAARINGVTRDGDKCTTFAECKELIEGGSTDIDYDGPAGPMTFGESGEPTEASFAILSYDEENKVGAGVETEYRFANI